jgi:hypothetical protein
MNSKALRTHGENVLKFSRDVPNMGRLGDLTRATVDMLRSKDWRDYSDATGPYHFYPGEFDYFLALQTVNARDVARFYLTPEERTEIASAMDRSRTGESRYRRSILEVASAHPHAAQSLTMYWERYAWTETKYPVGARAIVRARTGVSREEHERQARIKRLRKLGDGWRDRVAQVVAAAEGFTREELLAAIEALRKLAQTAPKLVDERSQWRQDAEELNWSERACASRWRVTRDAARMRLSRLKSVTN